MNEKKNTHRLSFERSQIVVERCDGEAHRNPFIDNCGGCMGTGWGIVAYDRADPKRRKVRAELGRGVKTFDYGEAEVGRFVGLVVAELKEGGTLRAAAAELCAERFDRPPGAPDAVVAMVQAVLVCVARGADLYPEETASAKAERAVNSALVALRLSV